MFLIGNYALPLHLVETTHNDTELPQLLGWACFQLRSLDQPPQIDCFTEAAGFGVLP